MTKKIHFSNLRTQITNFRVHAYNVVKRDNTGSFNNYSLRGYYTPYQKLAYYVLYLNNTFLKNYASISKLPKELKKQTNKH